MKITRLFLSLAVGLSLHSLGAAAEVEPGFKSLFNGKDLTGWEGNPELWSVQDGAITGKTSAEKPLKHNTFLVNTAGTVESFELRFSYRIVAGNSGVQYRSKVTGKGDFGPIVGGYQGDFEAGKTYSGILYEERGRGILAQRGQKTVIKADPNDANKTKVEVTGKTSKTSEELQAAIKSEDWNDYVIIADGNHLQHFINGNQTIDVLDEQADKAAKSGILALQIHTGPPMVVQFKNIRIKTLDGKKADAGDLQKFQGQWTGAKGNFGGNPISDDDLAAVLNTYKGKNYTAVWSSGSDEGTLELNETTSPKSLDVKAANGNTIPAIYRFTDAGLEICYGFDDAGRPTKFEAPEGSKFLVITYKRK
jgi:uncharacterized protein (TIGR03067 family)